MTACELIDSDKFLGADNDFNLFCCIRDSTSETDDEKARLKVGSAFSRYLAYLLNHSFSQERGYYYLGEMVNVFRQGTLVDSIRPALFTNPILYGMKNQIVWMFIITKIFIGTADGGLGAIVQLPPKIYTFVFYRKFL